MLKLLIVEDEQYQRDFLTSIQWESHDIMLFGCAKDGIDALKILKRENIDVLLLDMNMPEMDGVQFLKSLSILPQIPKIVVLSASGQYDLMREALLHNVSDYLLKPATVKEIVNAVKRTGETYVYSGAAPAVGGGPMVRRAVSFVQSNYMKPISATDVAKALFVTPSYLSAAFSKETGETLANFINRVRLSKACELLKSGEYKIYEIAYLTGYETEKYFFYVFKKYIGLTPLQFRNQHSKAD